MSDFKITVFAHVFNEEDLIPHWLNHHKNMFDHGVIINYYSTDNTVNIINKICPTWDIISPTESFGACVNQIHELESKYDGWKIALNVTEFLFINDLRNFIIKFENDNPSLGGIRTRGCIIVDNNNAEIDIKMPIVLQYTHGYFEEDIEKYINHNDLSDQCLSENEHISKTATWINMGIDGRSRLLHKFNYGKYLQGRHTTLHTNVYPRNSKSCPESELILLHFGYAPYTICKTRHITGCSARRSHLNIESLISCHANISYNLLNNEKYKHTFNNIMNMHLNSVMTL
jgi:hypothetical protein